MHNWFEIKAKYDKTLENGSVKTVTETYLVDALSHAEAEARAIEELRPYISGEFSIEGVKKAKLSELFFNDTGDRYYKTKVMFISLDEKSGMEKRTSANMLVQASSFIDAYNELEKGTEGTMADYWIAGMNETTIMDVFPYHAPNKTEN